MIIITAGTHYCWIVPSAGRHRPAFAQHGHGDDECGVAGDIQEPRGRPSTIPQVSRFSVEKKNALALFFSFMRSMSIDFIKRFHVFFSFDTVR